jgi:hypothetical protein
MRELRSIVFESVPAVAVEQASEFLAPAGILLAQARRQQPITAGAPAVEAVSASGLRALTPG